MMEVMEEKQDLFGVKEAYINLCRKLEDNEFHTVEDELEDLLIKSRSYREKEVEKKLYLMKAYVFLRKKEYQAFINYMEETLLQSNPFLEEVTELAKMAIEKMLSEGVLEGERLVDFYFFNSETEQYKPFYFYILLYKAIFSFQNREDVVNAQRYFSELLEGVEGFDDPYLNCRICSDYGAFLEVTGKSKEAKKYYEKARYYSQLLDNYFLEAQIELSLGILRFRLAHWDAAYFHFKRALGLYINANNNLDERSKYLERIAQLKFNLGYTAYKMKKFERAISYYKEALQDFMECRDYYGAADVLSVWGRVYEEKGNLKDARRQFEEALKILNSYPAENKETAFLKIILLKELAKLKEKANDFEEEEKNLLMALTVAKKFSLWKELYELEIELGRIRLLKNDIKKAKEYLLSAQDKMFRFKDKVKYGDFYENYAMLLFIEKNLIEALKYAKLAYDVYNSYHKPLPLARITYLLAKIYDLMKENQNAHNMIDLAINICKYEKFYPLLQEAYQFKSDLYAKQNDIRSANLYKSYAYQIKREHKL